MPYSYPVLERIAASEGIELHVLYCRRSLPGRGVAPAPPAVDHEFLPSTGLVHVRNEVRELDLNPTVVARLQRLSPDLVVVSGYVQPTMLLAMAWAKVRGRRYGIM